ncbi:MAG: hypothetical protein ACPG6P_11530 [Akkermansiaceae bacterium]
MKSSDGKKWDRVGPDFKDQYSSVLWTGSKYVVMGDEVILTSTDGEVWQRMETEYLLEDGVWTGQMIVAIDVLGKILTTPDGVTWTERYDDEATGNQFFFRSIDWSGSQLLVTGSDDSTFFGSGVLMTSSDGLAWTRRHPGPWDQTSGSSPLLYDAAWGNGQWVAVGESGASLTSPDGISWTSQSRTSLARFYGVTWANGLFYTAASDGVYTSSDGVVWSRRNGTFHGEFLQSIDHGNGIFVTVGHNGAIESSENGEEWTNRGAIEHDADFRYSFFRNGEVWVINPHGDAISSKNGEVWTGRDVGSGRLPNAMVDIGDGKMMILENGGGLHIVEGETTTSPDSGTTKALMGGCTSGDLLVVVGEDGTILTSPDGETWTERQSGVTNLIWDVTWTGVNFVAVTNSVPALISPDGVTWTRIEPDRSVMNSLIARAVVYADGVVYAGSGGEIFRSYDHGVTWGSRVYLGARDINGLAWTGHALIAVGDNGEIWLSRKDFNAEYVKWIETKKVKMFESAPLQDANNDGVTNLMAYALDLQHESNIPAEELARVPTIHTNAAGTNVYIEFEKPIDRAAVKYIIEISSSLDADSWTSIAEKQPGQAWTGSAPVQETPSEGGRVKVRVDYPETIQNDGLRFIRLRTDWVESP